MKAPPLLLLGGRSPVVAYLRHSIIVFPWSAKLERIKLSGHAVFPEPLAPTIKVKGVWRWMLSPLALLNDRTLKIFN